MKTSPSTLGRLLEEISWEGNARHYRDGGRGFENVLTAEIFQALDFLPRTNFLARIIRSLDGGAPEALKLFAEQAEQVSFGLLPGDIFLAEHPAQGESPLSVQPDGVLESPDVYCFLETKRIKRGAFQPEQLAREFLAVLQEAEHRRALLLLVLPKPPPVPVRGYGQLALGDAVARWLPAVLKRADGEFPPIDELLLKVEPTIAYTTWQRISEAIEAGIQDLAIADASVRASVSRLAQAALDAIRWHG